jgi:hypothetical protein
MRKLEMENARELLAKEAAPNSPLAAIVNAIATFWVNGSLPAPTVERLKSIYPKAIDSGLFWAATPYTLPAEKQCLINNQ